MMQAMRGAYGTFLPGLDYLLGTLEILRRSDPGVWLRESGLNK